jgi:hypothetical protein
MKNPSAEGLVIMNNSHKQTSRETGDTSKMVSLWRYSRSYFALYTVEPALARRISRLKKAVWFGTYYLQGWLAEQYLIPVGKKQQILRVLREGGYQVEWTDQ